MFPTALIRQPDILCAHDARPRLPYRIRAGRGRISRFGATVLRKFALNESLPLFAADDVLGAALLGPARVQEWQQIAPLLETRGLPKVDPQMGGRYTRAVIAFFDHLYGLDHGGDVPFAPDGVEDFAGWKRKQKSRN